MEDKKDCIHRATCKFIAEYSQCCCNVGSRTSYSNGSEYYNNGLAKAIATCIDWAEQCGGGDGRYGEEYRNLANSISKLYR